MQRHRTLGAFALFWLLGCVQQPAPVVGPVTSAPPPQACGGGRECEATELCQLPDGVCFDGGTGTCVARPEMCTKEYRPVCGCDGKTYGNDCTRAAAGVSKRADGACP